MASITFFNVQCQSMYEAKTWSYKSDSSNNWNDVTVHEGGEYVRKPRWHKCRQEEASFCTLESVHPDGIHDAWVALDCATPEGQELINFVSQYGLQNYIEIVEALNAGAINENNVPTIILRLMKAKGLKALRQYGDCHYTQKFGYAQMACLGVEPLKASSSKPDPALPKAQAA